LAGDGGAGIIPSVDEPYIHGYSREEQRRLTAMQALLNDGVLAALDLSGVRSILDVGSGLGQFARALARAAGPEAHVVGVERDARQLAEAARQASDAGESDLVEFRVGDATSLPLSDEERGSFDLAHARFLLEHVSRPLDVVVEMVSAVREGGRVVLIDDDHDMLRLHPDCPEMDGVWREFWESFRDHGCDPLIGRRLAELLHAAGARPTRVTTVFYGAVRGERSFDAVVDNLIGVVEGAAEGLDRGGRVPRARLDRALEALARWRERDAATVWYSLPLAEGRR